MNPAEIFPFVADGVHVLPVLHERLEYAACVREAMERLRPDAVLVEIPSSLERIWARAVDRLPAVSVLLYESSLGRTIYLPVHPGDPMVEAARGARERDIPLCCGDLDADGYADYRDPTPDPYALTRLGLPELYRLFRQSDRARDPWDDRREASMAYHARRLQEEGAATVLLVCGMHHAEGVAGKLEHAQATPLTPVARKGTRLVHLHPESLAEVLSEIPFYLAVYERSRRGVPPEPVERDAPPPSRSHGPFRVLSGGSTDESTRTLSAIDRAARVGPGGARFDRLQVQWALLGQAERALEANVPEEKVQRWQRSNLARFSRNLALMSGQLVVDLFDLLAAAKSCVSENFAWELHRLAAAYPAQDGPARDLPTVRIRADEMFDGVRRIRMERRVRRPKRPDWRRVLTRRRRSERWPGEWLEGFDEEAICSYPPEDVVVEEFGRYLRRRGKTVLSEERSRTVPFTTSILDGIDVRETIRHWPDRRVYVRELGRAPGEVGSVLAVFDEDEERYPYMQTWIGEHDQESDMAFYSTDPAQGIVGPGICRATYGGFVLSNPPRRMADVWTDPDYRMAESKAEVLLLAALDYCVENILVYVGPRPPRTILQQLATRLGIKMLYLPLGTLSPSTVRKLRVMHILSGHEKRKVAKDYIW